MTVLAGAERKMLTMAAVVATTALFAPDAAVAARADTEVSISSKVPAFHGRVSSGDRSCREDRAVQLYRRVAGSGKKRIGRTTSNGAGRWEIAADELSSGAYFAKVKGSTECRSAKSESVVVD